MPYLYVKLAFDEEIPQIEPKINPLPEGLAWIRGMDIEPVLSDVKIISAAKQELMKRRVRLGPRCDSVPLTEAHPANP